MNIIEKRDYIHNYLHLADSDFIEDIYKKMHTSIKGRKVIIGYDANGNQISSAQFLSELKEAERQIKQGEFITLEQLEKESDEW